MCMAMIIVKGVVMGSADVNPVTKETIKSALGYNPADSDQVKKNTSDIERLLAEGAGSGVRSLNCATFLLMYSEDRLYGDIKYEVSCSEEEMRDIINKIDSHEYDFTNFNVQFIVDDGDGEIGESTATPRYAIVRGTSITLDNAYGIAIISCNEGKTNITIDDDRGINSIDTEEGTIITFSEPVSITSELEIEVMYPLNTVAYQLLKNNFTAIYGELTYSKITSIVNPNGIYTDAKIPDEPEESFISDITDDDIVNDNEEYEGDATDEDIMNIFNGTD